MILKQKDPTLAGIRFRERHYTSRQIPKGIVMTRGTARRRIRRSEYGIRLLALATAVAIFDLFFPAFTMLYAERSISWATPISHPAQLGGNDEPANPEAPETTIPSQAADGTPARADLGVPKYPIVSDVMRDAWLARPLEALQEANSAVFGPDDPYGPYLQLGQQWGHGGDGLAQWAWRTEGDHLTELAGAPNLISFAFESDPPSETEVLDLAGLLILHASAGRSMDNDGDAHMDLPFAAVIAVALLQEARELYGTCDSYLAYAHAISLQSIDDPLVRQAYLEARDPCSGDPAGRVAEAYLELATVTRHFVKGSQSPKFDAGDLRPAIWEPIISEFQSIQSEWPENPAGLIGEGDAYLSGALQMRQQGYQAFSVQAYLEAALLAFGKAQQITSAPEVTVSMAQALVHLGKWNQASEVLETLPAALAGTELTVHSKRLSLAHQDKLEAALAIPNPEPLEVAVVVPSGIYTSDGGFGFSPVELTATRDAWQTDRLIVPEDIGAGSTAMDASHTPADRDGLGNQLGELLLLADREEDFLQAVCGDEGNWELGRACELIAEQAESGTVGPELIDLRQDIMRMYGRFDDAKKLLTDAISDGADDAVVHERLGELHFLAGDWAGAAGSSSEALDRAVSEDDIFGFSGFSASRSGSQWAALRVAVAYRNQGRFDDAHNFLVDSEETYETIGETEDVAIFPIMLLREQAALSYARRDLVAAWEQTQRVVALGRDMEIRRSIRILGGAELQLGAFVAMELGDFDNAVSYAQAAVDIDPYNPLFLESLAEVERKASSLGSAPEAASPSASTQPAASAAVSETPPPNDDEEQADQEDPLALLIDSYRRALDVHPSLFSAWNNLGVLLLKSGAEDAALQAFEQAIQHRDDYATAWFNLGVVEAGRSGFTSFVRSQGAFGQASSLNRDYKTAERQAVFDEEIYDSGLDISKEIPPGWELSQTSRSRISLFSVGLLVMVGVRIVWELGSGWLLEKQLADMSGRARRGRGLWSKVWHWRPAGMWTTLGTIGVAVMLSGAQGLGELGFVLLVVFAVLALHSAATHNFGTTESVRQRSMPAATLLGLALAPLGLGFAPAAPVEQVDRSNPKTHRAATAALTIMAVITGTVAVLTPVPLARGAALAAILILSSSLVPVRPLDGAGLGFRRLLELAVSVGMAATALGVATLIV